jgi:transposase
MERDPDAPHGGYTSDSYIKALEEGLLPHYRGSHLLMQDNGRIHTSCAVRDFLANHNITTLDWLAYSPDLNPIEHL